jgi:uncharacterized protein (DUF2267 family)
VLQTQVEGLNRTVEKTHDWLRELERLGRFGSEQEAYSNLRAVLQALRDRLTVDEAAHLAAQLPTLVRGVYYEGWRPSASPTRERSRDEFLDAIERRFTRPEGSDPEHAARSVFQLLDRKVSEGEIDDVRNMLPHEVQELWPAH